MRADRLITTVLLLQSRGRLSARQLADELEVSVRTVMRDIEALGASGVPVYSIRGPSGGYELWDGFRSQLTGLTAEEAAAVTLLGSPTAATVLGLADARQRVELKLRQSLPPHLRSEIDELGEWFYDDEGETGRPEHEDALEYVRIAIARRRVITARTSHRSAQSRTLLPLGLVRRASSWYVVAMSDGQPERFSITDLSEIRTTGRRFERPVAFDLKAFWHGTTQGEPRNRG